MDALNSTAIPTKDEAFALFARYFRDFDNSIFASMIESLASKDDTDVFSMMRGSGNEMSIPTMARYLLRSHDVLTEAETNTLVDMEHAARKLERAA